MELNAQAKIFSYLREKKSAALPDVADIWQKLEELYDKKLYHQLTVQLKKAIYSDSFTAGLNLKEFHQNFISEFAHRISPLQYVEIVIPVAKYVFNKIDRNAGFEFLSSIERSIERDKEAMVRLKSGEIELRLMNKDSHERCLSIHEIRQMIEDTQVLLDDLPGVSSVHAPFYKVSSIYLKEIGDHAGYYREALRYLGCEDQQLLSTEEKKMQALLLGFAALLGEDIYNFGELLAHPILKALDNTPEKWVVDVLYAFNAGDLNKFREYEEQMSGWDDIKKHKDFLIAKIQLLSLMEIALGRPSKERYIPFDEIAAKAQIDLNKVEFLVMKALSKGLVKGSIDQVNHLVNITWVQPRVLSPEQIFSMSERINLWCGEVERMEEIVMNNAKEILTKS
uniref:26S proteasome non-ATPase regulatory subunit 13 n=1 Tax=Syphacia muris TaxID=451379 RepID=A0A0N5AG69_9BILA